MVKTFYLIGLGLYDEKDLSLRAVEALRKCDKVYAEFYTNTLKTNNKKISDVIQKPVVELSREECENMNILNDKSDVIALLVPGDPLVSTTHAQYLLEAKKRGIRVVVVHASSILTSVCESGLSSYKFGGVTSIPKPAKDYNPSSYLDVINKNLTQDYHTLVLIDTKHGFNVSDALKILLEKVNNSKDLKQRITPNTKIIVFYGLGSDEQLIKYSSIKNIIEERINIYPQCFVIPGVLSHFEKELLECLST